MNKKAAIGLSINTLVIVIISLVILGSGVTLLYKFIGSADSIKGSLDQRTNQELERLLVDQGRKVALPLHTKTLERGDTHTFGMGILNIGGVGDQFKIEVGLVRYLDQGTIVDLTEEQKAMVVNSWLLYNDQEINLEEAEHHKEAILVNVPNEALVGDYIFNVKVYVGAIQYGTTQKFYVTVK